MTARLLTVLIAVGTVYEQLAETCNSRYIYIEIGDGVDFSVPGRFSGNARCFIC